MNCTVMADLFGRGREGKKHEHRDSRAGCHVGEIIKNLGGKKYLANATRTQDDKCVLPHACGFVFFFVFFVSGNTGRAL
jgi:hypothetical protein